MNGALVVGMVSLLRVFHKLEKMFIQFSEKLERDKFNIRKKPKPQKPNP